MEQIELTLVRAMPQSSPVSNPEGLAAGVSIKSISLDSSTLCFFTLIADISSKIAQVCWRDQGWEENHETRDLGSLPWVIAKDPHSTISISTPLCLKRINDVIGPTSIPTSTQEHRLPRNPSQLGWLGSSYHNAFKKFTRRFQFIYPL